MKRMIVLFIFNLFLFTGCLDVLPFYKYEADPDPVTVEWNINQSSATSWEIREKHDWSEGSGVLNFDGSCFSDIQTYRDWGQGPVFGNLTAFADLSPFSSLSGYLHYFLNGVVLGNVDDTIYTDKTTVHYDSYTGQAGWNIPYEADIANSNFKDFLDSSQLPSPGSFAVVEFHAESDDSFLDGDGIAIFHDGQPSGLLYFAFRHNSGYLSLFYLENFNSSVSGSYFGELEGDYTWYFYAY